MVLPGKIFISKNTKVLNVDLRLKINIFILLIVKQTNFWPVGKLLLIKMVNYEI